MNEIHSQAFRVKSSSDEINIPTRHDPKSGQRVVRWIDIQQYFKNAQGIMNGKDAVLFLTNDELEDLTPRRIAHLPGVVLEVLVADNCQANSSTTETLGSTSSSAGIINDMSSRTRDVVSLRITEVEDDNQALVVHSQNHHSERQISLHALNSIHNTYSHQPVPTPKESPVSNTNPLAHDLLPTQQSEVNSNMTQQDELQQLNQRIQEILKSVPQTQQSIQHLEPQAREQINETLLQKPLQESVNETDQGSHLTLDQIRKEISQSQQEMLTRHVLVQYRVQALLSIPLEDLLIPRLFIVLPKGTGVVDGREGGSSLQFRLHFLCERGSQTMTKDTERTQEVHMTNHAGYDLRRPQEFFNKFGSNVLTMMYMVKYGSMVPGFFVPPLSQSKLVARIEERQEHLGFIKKNISRLVDDMITYLEGVTRIIDDMEAASLKELKSYFDVIESDHFSGDLHRSTTQDPRSSWICSEHRRGWTMQHLKDVIGAIGGTYTEEQGKFDIKVTSDGVGKKLFDAIVEVCRVQCIDNKQSLVADCGQLSLTVCVSQEVQDVIVTIKQLSDLTVDGLGFIQQCNITQLAIKLTPQEADEDRLTSILQQSPKLKELCIGCLDERSLAIIKLVISTREKALQNGRQSALRIFKVTDEGKPFSLYRARDVHDHITTTVTFSEESATFDMDTCINLQNKHLVTEGSRMSNFFRQYGWSISSLEAPCTFTDHLATLLDDATQIHGSRLEHLVLSHFSLTYRGLDAVDRVIRRSQRLVFLWLLLDRLDQESQPEKAVLLLGRYGEKLNKLTLRGDSIERWLPQLARNFPTRSTFPTLSVFEIKCHSKQAVSLECAQWLASMVSTPLQQTMKPSITVTRLERFELIRVTLRPQDWETLVKALDFSSIKWLDFDGTNFSLKQLDLMIDRIAGTDATSVPLTCLDLRRTELLVDADKSALRARIEKVLPRTRIEGL